MNKSFPNLNQSQRKQVRMQWHKHQHHKIVFDFELTPYGDILKDFVVNKGVWNPNIVSARYHASYLFHNNARLFQNKNALDMGCGSGLMAIVMVLYGARRVVCSDISRPAVENTRENAKNFGLAKKMTVVQGDLFEKINKKFDFIAFMQPYFADEAPKNDTIAASMLNNGELVKRFLKEAPSYMKPGCIILMPSFDLAGPKNNPAIQGPKYGFDVKTTFSIKSHTGLQKGVIKMHELTYLKINVNK